MPIVPANNVVPLTERHPITISFNPLLDLVQLAALLFEINTPAPHDPAYNDEPTEYIEYIFLLNNPVDVVAVQDKVVAFVAI